MIKEASARSNQNSIRAAGVFSTANLNLEGSGSRVGRRHINKSPSEVFTVTTPSSDAHSCETCEALAVAPPVFCLHKALLH